MVLETLDFGYMHFDLDLCTVNQSTDGQRNQVYKDEHFSFMN